MRFRGGSHDRLARPDEWWRRSAHPQADPCRGDVSARRAEDARVVWRLRLQEHHGVLHEVRLPAGSDVPRRDGRISRPARPGDRPVHARRGALHRRRHARGDPHRSQAARLLHELVRCAGGRGRGVPPPRARPGARVDRQRRRRMVDRRAHRPLVTAGRGFPSKGVGAFMDAKTMEVIAIPTAAMVSSRIGLGTWSMGGWMWGGSDETEAIATIRSAIDLGITLIDTAPAYGFGRSEELVGRAIAEHGARDRVLIATKVGLAWRAGRVYRNASAQRIRAEVEDSLRRLRTSYIDI